MNLSQTNFISPCPTFVATKNCTFVPYSSAIQKQLHHKFKRKRMERLSYLEKRPDTLYCPP